MATVEIWMLIDDTGEVVASHDADLLNDLYEEHVQGVSDAAGLRRVKVTLSIPLPTPIEVTGTVPAEPEPAPLAVA